MIGKKLKRRDFLKKSAQISVSAVLSGIGCSKSSDQLNNNIKPPESYLPSNNAVSIVKIKNGKVSAAVEEALELLGGVEEITKDKNRIMLKPNLVAEGSTFTTKPAVIKSIAQLMKKAGKEVLIGEGSAAAGGFNAKNGAVFRTKRQQLIDDMQKFVFDSLGYTTLAKELDVPLINLHSGDMNSVDVPNGYAYESLHLHHTLTEIDMLCSVPMMKTHTLATVTLGMKNLLGLYPGTVYKTVRAGVHDYAADKGSAGVAYEIIDMVRANKLGLVVVDGWMAMEGNGPVEGALVSMNLIVAGTNPLATDMVAANVMGFEPYEIPTFVFAQKAGMKPRSISEVEIRGENIDKVKRKFVRPQVVTWNSIRDFWGVKEI